PRRPARELVHEPADEPSEQDSRDELARQPQGASKVGRSWRFSARSIAVARFGLGRDCIELLAEPPKPPLKSGIIISTCPPVFRWAPSRHRDSFELRKQPAAPASRAQIREEG